MGDLPVFLTDTDIDPIDMFQSGEITEIFNFMERKTRPLRTVQLRNSAQNPRQNGWKRKGKRARSPSTQIKAEKPAKKLRLIEVRFQFNFGSASPAHMIAERR